MKAEIRPYNGTPVLFLDEQPVFASHQWLSSHPGPAGFPGEACVREFGKAGVHLYAIAVGAVSEWCGHWCGPREGHPEHYDFSMVERQLRGILQADPQAHFHLRMYFETTEWWNRLYPDECELASNGKRLNQSYASLIWREQVKDFIRAYAIHLQAIGLFDRVIAYQVQAGVCGEWIKNTTSMSPLCGDFSQPMRLHFRAWLRQHYHHDVSMLQSAWADPRVTFDTAEVPAAEEQHKTTHLLFRDPCKERNTIDYYRCLSELCADDLIEFCHTVKEVTHGQALAGAFYGYLMELSWNDAFFGDTNTSGEFSTIQRSGHLGLRKVLRSPEVDYLVTPYGYAFRGIGGDGLPMTPAESARIHNKLYILEEDSHLHNELDPEGRNFDRKHTIAINQREFAQALTHGFGIWWYADCPVGSYTRQNPNFQPWLERFQKLGTWGLQLDNRPNAEVAVLLDDESFYYETIRNDIDLPSVFHQRVQGLSRFGAPHDVYLLEDLLEGRLPPYKLYIFLNAFALDDARRQALAQQIRHDGTTALWIYAPGYINPRSDLPTPFSLDNMTDLTGFRFGQGLNPWGPFMHITNFTHAITHDVPQDLFWGTNNRLGPLFHIEDLDATILGQVVYSLGRCKPGFGVKTLPATSDASAPAAHWNSVYIAAPNVPAPVLRGIARFAGVHLYSDAGDVLYATPQLLAVHTTSGGLRTLRLPKCVDVVYDLYNDQIIDQKTTEFKVTLSPVSSALYYTGDMQTLKSYRS